MDISFRNANNETLGGLGLCGETVVEHNLKDVDYIHITADRSVLPPPAVLLGGCVCARSIASGMYHEKVKSVVGVGHGFRLGLGVQPLAWAIVGVSFSEGPWAWDGSGLAPQARAQSDGSLLRCRVLWMPNLQSFGLSVHAS